MNFANMIARETFKLTAFIVILSKISVQFVLRKCVYPIKMMIREDGPVSTPLEQHTPGYHIPIHHAAYIL